MTPTAPSGDAPRKPTTTAEDWDRRYREADTPWDSGVVDPELRRAVEAGELKPCRILELGCGTGTNAVFLARAGFTVAAVDLAPLAVERARARARDAGVAVEIIQADVAQFDALAEPFEAVFDRGCYHCVRRAGKLAGYLATVKRLTAAGSRLLILAGNPDAAEEGGPPKVTAAELCGDFERLCRIERLAAYRFEDAGNKPGPLGWSLWMTRR